MTKLKEALHEMYRRAFAASTPPADFDRLMAIAPVNEFGEREIPYMDHACDKETMEQIFQDVAKEYNLSGNDRIKLMWSYWLGASPKSK